MVQGYNCGNPCNDNSTLLLLLLLCPGIFGGIGGCGNNNILPLILIMSMCGGGIC